VVLCLWVEWTFVQKDKQKAADKLQAIEADFSLSKNCDKIKRRDVILLGIKMTIILKKSLQLLANQHIIFFM